MMSAKPFVRSVSLQEDVQAMAYPVLRHRLLLSYHAQAEGITANQVIDKLLNLVGSA